jgi:hypothetical protein
LIGEKAGYANEARDTDGEEAEAYFADVEVVNGGIHEWECFEEGVVYAVSEGRLRKKTVNQSTFVERTWLVFDKITRDLRRY